MVMKMETLHKSPKEIVTQLIHIFSLNTLEVNWALQMKLAKSLLSKYSYDEIIYALNYYKSKGDNVYSLGFLKYRDNMKYPTSLYHTEQNTQETNDDSGKRNRERVRQNRQAKYRKNPAEYLFTVSGDDD